MSKCRCSAICKERDYLWFYSVPGGDVILEFCDSRGEQAPREKLVGFRGTMQTGAYQVYLARKRNNPALEGGCLGSRTAAFLPSAGGVVPRSRLVYRKDSRAVSDRTPGADLTPSRAPGGTPTAGAADLGGLAAAGRGTETATFAQKHAGQSRELLREQIPGLDGYLRDGRFQIDNNLVEKAIRPAALGRRRWRFIGHPQAGWRGAVIYSILISCRRRGLYPEEYLSDVLARLPSMKNNQIHELLPGQWKPPSANTS